MTKEAEDIVQQWGAIKEMRRMESEMIKKMEQMQRKVKKAEIRKKTKKDKK